jgi:hypothetical protein
MNNHNGNAGLAQAVSDGTFINLLTCYNVVRLLAGKKMVVYQLIVRQRTRAVDANI